MLFSWGETVAERLVSVEDGAGVGMGDTFDDFLFKLHFERYSGGGLW